MKIAIITALTVAGVFGQSAERRAAAASISEATVPTILEGHGVRSTILVTGNYEMFEHAAGKIPDATAVMEQGLGRAKQHGAEDIEEDIKIFHATEFDLRYFHFRTLQAMDALRAELTGKYFRTRDPLPLSDEEQAAADRWLARTTKDMERDFATAMARYEKTSRRVERYLDHHPL